MEHGMRLEEFFATKKGSRQQTLSHELLQRLDLVKPLMVLPLSKLVDWNASLRAKIPASTTLEFWNIPVEDLKHVLPDTVVSQSALSPLAALLSFSTVGKFPVKKLSVLDVITVLCLLLDGEWDVKMRLLFGWYNLNMKGLLEEEEHFLFLQRVGISLRKLKFIGPLDLTDDDAKFIAIEARVVFDATSESHNPRGRFRPGMYLDDFVQWSKTHPICQLLFKFVQVFQRLIDMLSLLEMRSQKLQEIAQQKRESLQGSAVIPMALSSCSAQAADNSIRIIYRDSEHLSVIIPRLKPHTRIFSRIDKEIHYDEPFQKFISRNIINRNVAVNAAMHLPNVQCCRRTYDVTTVQEVFTVSCASDLSKNGQECLMLNFPTSCVQIRVPLSDSCRFSDHFRVTIFTDSKVFRTVRVKLPVWNSQSNDLENCRPLLILPSTIDHRRLADIVSHKKAVDKSVFYTGTIGDYDDIMKMMCSSLMHMDPSLINWHSIKACLRLTSMSLRSKMNIHWMHAVQSIVDSLYVVHNESLDHSPSPKSSNDPIQCLSSSRSLLFFNGRGPWGSSHDSLQVLQQHLGDQFFSVTRTFLEKQYENECSSVLPPINKLMVNGNLQVYAISERSCNHQSGMGVLELTRQLQDDLRNAPLLIAQRRQLVILLKNPSALFQNTYGEVQDDPFYQFLTRQASKRQNKSADTTDKLHKSEEFVDQEAVSSSVETNPTTGPSRGKHEILFGEWLGDRRTDLQQLKQQQNSFTSLIDEVSPDDPNLLKCIATMLSYSANVRLSNAVASIILVSVDWCGGENFRIKVPLDDDQVISVEHINLQSTLEALPIDVSHYQHCQEMNEWIMRKLKLSLPTNVVIESLPASKERTMTISSRGVEFEELPEIKGAGDGELPRNFVAPDRRSCVLTNFPRSHFVSEAEAVVGVEVAGTGKVLATLYELPLSMTFSIFQQKLASSSRRSSLKTISSQSKFAHGRNCQLKFRWLGLQSNATYGVWFSTDADRNQESLDGITCNPKQGLLFRTLSVESNHISSFFFLSLIKNDFDGCASTRQSLLTRLFDQYRESPSLVIGLFAEHEPARPQTFPLIHDPNLITQRLTSLFSKPLIDVRNKFDSMSKSEADQCQYEFVHRDEIDNVKRENRIELIRIPTIGQMQVAVHGLFAYFVPTHASNECLHDMIRILDSKWLEDTGVKVLVVFTAKLLIHALFAEGNSSSDSYRSERLTYDSTIVVSAFCSALLRWKLRVSGREVKLIGSANIPEPRTVIISSISYSGTANENSTWDTKSKAETASVGASSVVSFDDKLSLGSQFSRALAEKSHRMPLHPLELSHLSSVFAQNGLQFFIFPIYASSSMQTDEEATKSATTTPRSKSHNSSSGNLSLSSNTSSSAHNKLEPKVILPEGVQSLDDDLFYEILPPHYAKFSGMSFTKARHELYPTASKRFNDNEAVIYRVDLLIDDLFSVPLPDPQIDFESSLASLTEFESPTEMPTTLHGVWMHAQELRSTVDLLRMVVGPLIGKITMSEARLVCEFNLNLPEVTCILRKTSNVDPYERNVTELIADKNDNMEDAIHASATVQNVDAYHPIVFSFANLQSDCKYEIVMPALFPHKILGKFRTMPSTAPTVDILFTGDNHYGNMPILEKLVAEFSKSQSVNLQSMHVLNSFVHNVPTRDLVEYNRNPSLWNLLSDKINTPGLSIRMVVHIAPQTLLTRFWSTFKPYFLKIAERIPLDADSQKGSQQMMAMRLQQLDHSIKDTFLCWLSSPPVATVFSMCGNAVLYHSDYLFAADKDDITVDEASPLFRYTALIRQMFQKHVERYFMSLFEMNANTKDYFQLWRVGSVAVAIVDNVTGRNKGRSPPSAAERPAADSTQEPGHDSDEDDGKRQSTTAATFGDGESAVPASRSQPFSTGFIDRSQWKVLRGTALDDTISQLVIVFECPPLSIFGVESGSSFNTPQSKTVPWNPTPTDLQVFFQFWVDWIMKQRKSSKGMEIRSVVFVSYFDVPFATTIQDVRTGIKLHQLCLSRYSLPSNEDIKIYKTTPVIDPKRFVLQGKIGTMRYIHRIHNQDYCRIEPFSKESTRATMAQSADNQPSLDSDAFVDMNQLTDAHYCGFAKLKIFVDSWNPVNIWSNDLFRTGETAMARSIKIKAKTRDETNEAILIVGPIVGMPFRLPAEESSGGSPGKSNAAADVDPEPLSPDDDSQSANIHVPILIEVDRWASVRILATAVLSGDQLEIEAKNIRPGMPTVITIGPLSKNERYTVQMLQGLKSSPYNDFVISTHVHVDETNVVVVNGEMPGMLVPSTVLVTDLTNRCRVPFSGINAVVHLNIQPNFDALVQEHQYNQTLVDGLSHLRKNGKASLRLRQEVEQLIDAFRDKFRDVFARPSYRELLCSPSSHMILPKIVLPVFSRDGNEIDNEGRLTRATRLLQLIEMRVVQEYVDQLLFPTCHVFRAINRAQDPQHQTIIEECTLGLARGDFNREARARLFTNFVNLSLKLAEQSSLDLSLISAANISTAQAAISHHVYWSRSQDESVDVILDQWMAQCIPAPSVYIPWLSWNAKLTIEVVPIPSKRESCYVTNLIRLYEDLWSQRRLVVPRTLRSHPGVSIVARGDERASQDSPPSVVASADLSLDLQSEEEYSDHLSFAATRLVIFHGKKNPAVEDDLADLMSAGSDILPNIVRLLNEWKLPRSNRDFLMLYPDYLRGTRETRIAAKYTMQSIDSETQVVSTSETSAEIALVYVDSIHHSNEYERRHYMAEQNKKFQASRRKITASAGLSKKAQQRRVEEDRKQDEKVRNELKEVLLKQIPDGCVMIRYQTGTIVAAREDESQNSKSHTSPGEQDTVGPTVVLPESANDQNLPIDKREMEPEEKRNRFEHVHVITSKTVLLLGDKALQQLQTTGAMPDLAGGEGGDENGMNESTPIDPTYFLSLQLPMWMTKLLSPSASVFVQDDVYLVMRQSKKTRLLLDRIESGEFDSIFTDWYYKSRLSDLSRPEDLREVDFSNVELIPIFFRDVINRIWEEGLPADLKARMFDLSDALVRSFCFSRSLSSVDMLSSPKAFAQAVSQACVASIAMKTAKRVSRVLKYKHIMDAPDEATILVTGIQKEEQELEKQKIKLAQSQAELLASSKLLDRLQKLGTTSSAAAKPFILDARTKQSIDGMNEEIQLLDAKVDKLTAEEVNYDSDVEALDKEIAEEERRQQEEEDEADRSAEEKTANENGPRSAVAVNDDVDRIVDPVERTNKTNEMVQQVLNEVTSLLADEFTVENVGIASGELVKGLTNFEVPKQTADQRRAAAKRHFDRLKEYREQMRVSIGPRFMKMS